MADDRIAFEIDVDASGAISVVKSLTSSLSAFSKQAEVTARGAGATSASMIKVRDTSRDVTLAVERQKTAFKELAKEQQKTGSRRVTTGVVTPEQLNPRRSATGRVSTGVISPGPGQITTISALTTAQDRLATSGDKLSAADARVAQSFRAIERAAIKKVFHVNEVTDATERLVQRLPTLRYALYDVSNNIALAAGALTVMTSASFALAAQYERDFANVIRTTGVTGDSLKSLQKDFIDLKKEIPVSWTELTSIGTLAGQLNVPQQDIAEFSKIVAMFAATTDVSVEAAATAFGRLDQLVNGVNGNYKALGSSILAVGVNSVATESQIIAVAQNIASIGNQAGFSADQLIGFSGALASVGIQPELARGLTARLFGEIGTSISRGSVQLENFGQIAGMTGKQFSEAWRSDASSTLVSLLKGLSEEGTNAEASLAQLGITSVRDVPNILKLSQGYEEVARLLGVSEQGYAGASEITKQYGVIMATVAEKVKLLTGNIELFIAQSGAGVAVLGGFLDALNGIVKAAVDFASTPFGGAFLSISNAILGVVGIVGLLLAGLLRGTAAFVAWKTAALNAAIASGVFAEGTKAAEVSTASLGRALLTTSGFAATFGNVMKGTLITLGITAAIAAGFTAFDAISQSLKSAEEKAKDAMGGFEGLSDALKADTEAMREASVTNASVADSYNTVKSSVDGATYAIGDNTKAFLQNFAVTNEKIKAFVESARKINELYASTKNAGPQLDVEGFLTAAASNDVAGAKQILEDYKAEFATISGGFGNIGPDPEAMALANETLVLLSGGVQGAANEMTIAQSVATAFGGEINGVETDVASLNEKLSEIRTAVEDAFGRQNVAADFASDFEALVNGVAEGGNAFSAFSSAGRENLNNLQSSIGSTIAFAEVMGIDATEAVASMFLSLQAQGVDTANLLAMLANMKIPGVSVGVVSALVNGTRQMSPAGEQFSQTVNKMGSSLGGLSKKSGSASQSIRTLVDYSNDLSAVFERAFEIRFSGGQALDKINKSFAEMAQATSDARDEINALNADVQELQSNKALQEYFLSIAEAYGDTLRAQSIRANLSKIDADLTKKTQSLQKAQDKTNKTLVGNSDAAIENRSEIIGLVSNYQDYIKALAASGASQSELSAATANAKADFISQATQLGYNSNELGIYAVAFNDVTTAIDNVPRNITVDANVDPALQALEEIRAKASSLGGETFQGPTIISSATLQPIGPLLDSSDVGMTRRALESLNPQGLILIGRQLYKQGYSEGGYTGAGGKYDIAGVVHRGEYVVPKSQVNQSTGLPYFMSQMPKFYSGGATTGSTSSSSNVVALSAGSIQAIAQAVQPMLFLDGQKISDASSAAYSNNTKVGAF